ncbi:SusC/RagA family TonB-linked outer membrane protein [Pseudoflavitalea sp. G-6-1-2]|uniref:SusC/RagA family TonB-linked outer membrane protein n=1 Tax=Pseudoflavitalea sp. G-6-1-2 TaxID=2728841 RepID=UPI00146E1C8F|nr:SusC/RagA family TonB-linked outer membrane protein [Pseudoflavitalea sp. G-6-1-2]NML20715.1 SusC/RagA family TonB-linked outer membrane protein [Pseudoflavitalea sp. G-6-1-2]
MRLSIFTLIILGFCMHISATGVSQSVSFTGKKVPLIKVFNAIENQTGFVLFYDAEILEKMPPVTINADKMPLASFLTELLNDHSYEFSIQKRTIVISPKKVVTPASLLWAKPGREVRGKVTNENGEPVAGVTVTIKGTERGAATNSKGEFVLDQVEDNAILVFTSVSYETKEIAVAGRSTINMEVRTKVSSLGDVTVSVNTGYQKIPKERATGSFTIITSKELERRTSPDLLNLLEGMAPGLMINKSANGMEGQEDPSILMRGVSTFGSQQPLVVVDGFPIEGTLSTINPNDVETVTLLRDAAAAAIWGVKATNGVIVINTKKGKTLNPKVTFRSSFNMNERPRLSYLNLMNSKELADYEKNKFYADPDPDFWPNRITGLNARDSYTDIYGAFFDFEEGKITAEERDKRIEEITNYNNSKEVEKTYLNSAWSSDNTVSISAAPSDRFNYYASFAFLKGIGLYKGDNFKKSNVNFNTEIKLTSKLTLNIGANYTVNDQDISALKRFGAGSNSDVPGALKMLPYLRLRKADGSANALPRRFSNEMINKLNAAGLMDMNYYPLNDFKDYELTSNTNTLRLQSTLTYQFSKALSFNLSYKTEKINDLKSDLYKEDSYEARALINDFSNIVNTNTIFNIPKGAMLREDRGTTTNYYIRAQLDLNHTFNHDHRVDLNIGLERQRSVFDNTMDSRFGYNPVSNLSFGVDYATLSGAGNKNPVTGLNSQFRMADYFNKKKLDDRYIFYYFAGSYTYKGKYAFSTSARINKSSRFDPSAGLNKQILASAGVKWDILKEQFIKTPDWINQLQIRYTAGLTGNVPNITTSSMKTLAYASASYTFGVPMLSIGSPANKKLRWEPTLTHNLALDFSLLANRISGSVDLYYKKTTELLGQEGIDPTLTGFFTVPINSSDILNKGIELRLNTINVNTKDFRWQTAVNFGFNSNKVGFSTTNKNNVIGAPKNLTGYAARTFFALQWAGVDENGHGLLWDLQPDGKRVKIPAADYDNLTFEDYKVIGSIIPKYTAGFSNIFQYKGWDFSFLFIANGGHYMQSDAISDDYFSNSFGGSGFNNLPKDVARRWKKPGDEKNTNVPLLDSYETNQYNWSDINYQSATFIKLREVAVSYLFTKKQLGQIPMNSVKVNFQVRNPWKWVENSKGIDPEAHILQFGERTLPVTTTYTLGILANF